jgi:hypothetical protein
VIARGRGSGLLQEDNGLAVPDCTGADHGEGLGDADLKHVDVLAFGRVAATCGNSISGFVTGLRVIERDPQAVVRALAPDAA